MLHADAYLLMKTMSAVQWLRKERKVETVCFLSCLETYDIRLSLKSTKSILPASK